MDITSLSRRFEIPRSVLNDLKNIEDPIARFKELDRVVSELGFSQKVLEAQTQTTANTYDKAAAAFDNAKTAVGGYLAEILKIPAQVVTEVVLKRVAEDLPQALPQNVEKQQVNTQANFLQNASDVAAFNAEVERANGIINNSSVAVGLLGGYFTKLTPEMFNAARAAVQNGQSLQQVSQTITDLSGNINTMNSVFDTATRVGYQTAEATAAAREQMAFLAFSSQESASALQLLIKARLDEKISTTELMVALENLVASEQVIQAQAAATATAQGLAAQREGERSAGVKVLTDAQIEQSSAIVDAITKEQAQLAEEEKLKAVKEELARLAPLVANGTLTIAEASAIAAGKFNLEEAAIRGVIAAEADLAGIRGLRAKQDSQTRDAGTGKISTGTRTSRGSQTNRGTDQQRLDAIEAQQKANEELAASERAVEEARGGNEAKLANLRDDLAGLTEGTAAYNNKLAEVIALENQVAKAGAGGAKLSAQEKLDNSLLNQADKTNDKLENAEIAHQQNLLDIIEEFAAKQLAAQKKNEVDKRTSRADFYTQLIDEEGVNQQQFSAEYEKVFEESQKIAQAGNQQLANDYLKMRQQQIQDDIEFAKKRAEVAADEDLTKKEKEAKLAALDEIDKMRKAAQEEETKQLLEGGDQNVNALNEKLSEEEKRYNEQTGKIKTIADQQADARIAAWERANKTIAAQPPAELTNFSNAGIPIPQTTPAATTPEVALPTDQTVQTDATITDAQIMSVTVVGLALVRDEGVIAEISALASRLEAKLGELQQSVQNSGSSIVDKLGGVESAVKNIKLRLVQA